MLVLQPIFSMGPGLKSRIASLGDGGFISGEAKSSPEPCALKSESTERAARMVLVAFLCRKMLWQLTNLVVSAACSSWQL